MTCATCGRRRPERLFVIRAGTSRARTVQWCRDCRAAWRDRQRAADLPRNAGTNPRTLGTNPRAKGTNPRSGKAEGAGQWRAAWRRLSRLDPDAFAARAEAAGLSPADLRRIVRERAQ